MLSHLGLDTLRLWQSGHKLEECRPVKNNELIIQQHSFYICFPFV